jgi:hypothetical protein
VWLTREHLKNLVRPKWDEGRAFGRYFCVRKEGVYSTDGHRLMYSPLPDQPLAGQPREAWGGLDVDSQLEDGESMLIPFAAMGALLRMQGSRVPAKLRETVHARIAVDVAEWRAGLARIIESREHYKELIAAGQAKDDHGAILPAIHHDPEAFFRATALTIDGELTPVAVRMRVVHSDAFPSFESVIPKGDPHAVFGMNPQYLAEAAAAIAAFGLANGGARIELFDTGEQMSPIKITSQTTKAWVLVMPTSLRPR